ncbi:MAG: lipase family protein [Planctomycetota bacterium]|jgi:triacylglycerol lipase
MSTQVQASDGFRSKPLTIKLDRPIAELSWIGKSLVFAELSRLAYGEPDLVSKVAYEAGIDQCVFVAEGGSEAYVFGSDDDCMVVSRGTEPFTWEDLRADASAWTIAHEVGRVHRGFHQHVDLLWPDIEQALKENQRPVWFGGHSLGGAMAAVCAVRCKLSPIPSNPQAIFTFGAPRVGNRAYASFLRIKHFRWVNNNDIVPRIPPRWMGYHHMGREIYLNRRGKISRIHSWLRLHDRWRGFLRGLGAWKFDLFSDHSMEEYIGHIHAYYEAELRGERTRTPKSIVDRTPK